MFPSSQVLPPLTSIRYLRASASVKESHQSRNVGSVQTFGLETRTVRRSTWSSRAQTLQRSLKAAVVDNPSVMFPYRIPEFWPNIPSAERPAQLLPLHAR